jgi:hypothetical protein
VIVDGNNRWRSQESANGGRTATLGRNTYNEEVQGRKSSYRKFATILESIVDPGAATSVSAQVSRDQQCGRG